jgi:DNA-binding GntR family transcriptional regulator
MEIVLKVLPYVIGLVVLAVVGQFVKMYYDYKSAMEIHEAERAERIAWATEARLLVECHALKSLFEAPDDDPIWAHLRELQERHRVYRETPEPRYEEFYELDREFHRTLYRATKNDYLRAFEEVMSFFVLLQSQGAKLRPEIFFTACADHLKIIDAILQRKKREAGELLRDHLERAAAAIQSSLPPDQPQEGSAP